MRPPIPSWFELVLKFANGDPVAFWQQSVRDAKWEQLDIEYTDYLGLHKAVVALLQKLADECARSLYFPGDHFLGPGLRNAPTVVQRDVLVGAARTFTESMVAHGREDEPMAMGARVLLDAMESVDVLAQRYGGDSIPLTRPDRRPWPLPVRAPIPPTENRGGGLFFQRLDNVVIDTLQRYVRLYRCRFEECGKFKVDDRRVKDPRKARRYCGERCKNGYHNARRATVNP